MSAILRKDGLKTQFQRKIRFVHTLSSFDTHPILYILAKYPTVPRHHVKIMPFSFLFSANQT